MGNSSFTALKPLIAIHEQTVLLFSSTAFRQDTQPIMISRRLINLNQNYTYMSCNYIFETLNGLNTCDWFSRLYIVCSIRSTEDITLNFLLAHSWQSMSFLRISAANASNMLPGSIRERRLYSGFKFTLRRSLLGIAVANRYCVSKIFLCILRTPYIFHMKLSVSQQVLAGGWCVFRVLKGPVLAFYGRFYTKL